MTKAEVNKKGKHFCKEKTITDCYIKLCYLGHVDESQGQRLVAQDGPVLVTLPSLQHDLKLVGVPLEEVRILRVQKQTQAQTDNQLAGRWRSCWRGSH